MKITVFDDFNRANETPVAAPWTKPAGTLTVNLASNGLIGATSSGQRVIYYSATWPSNQASQATYTTISDGDAGIAVRVQNGATSFVHFVNRTVGNGGWLLESVVAGVSTTVIGSNAAAGGAVNDVVSLEVTSNAAGVDTFTAKVNGKVALQGTNNDLSGGSPGLSWFNTSTVLDNWYGGVPEVQTGIVTNSRHPGISPGDNSQSWRLLRGFTQDDTVAVAAGSTGTLATTNADDTSAASGTTTIVGALAKTNANDTSAAAGTTTVLGTLARTNAADTSAASGTTTVTGSLTRTNANDTSAASGSPVVNGSLARTNANDALVASGSAGAVTGTLAVTAAADTLAASGIVIPPVSTETFSGGYFPDLGTLRERRRKKQEEPEVEIAELPQAVVAVLPKAIKRRKTVTIEQLVGAVSKTEMSLIDLEQVFQQAQRKKRQQDDEELLLFY